MSIDVLAKIDKATERASTPRSSRKPVFLFLKEGQQALLRPMFSLNGALTLRKHDKWNDNPDYRVNAICAKEIDKACEHCANAKELEDRKLGASDIIYLPVYVHSVIDVKSGQKITYVEKDEHDNKIEKPVMGFRVLELPFYGKAFAILQYFRTYVRDEGATRDAGDIRACDFSIEQVGVMATKNFQVKTRPVQPVNPKIAAACPSLDKFKEAIFAAIPPLVVSERVDTPIAVQNTSIELDDGEIPEF